MMFEMEILGHSQISTTMNTYGHVLPEVQREAVNLLDGLFTEGDPGAAATKPPPNANGATLSALETDNEEQRQHAVDRLRTIEDDDEED
ncbi:hypothetical protein [Candidatus Chloroploca sp. Khr17]|uniref:hypothetical protein n=1 Tax=Candidatus Chloroploca sp. Khr17 TaxID=2496869 RepID=UPI00196A5E76|nr:hypothetical protein [Candidatus Chloroploca sp. Khr17]